MAVSRHTAYLKPLKLVLSNRPSRPDTCDLEDESHLHFEVTKENPYEKKQKLNPEENTEDPYIYMNINEADIFEQVKMEIPGKPIETIEEEKDEE